MTNKFYLLSIMIVLLSSCDNKKKSIIVTNDSDTFKRNIISHKLDSITQMVDLSCSDFSKSMKDIIDVLSRDNYSIEVKDDLDTLFFKSYKKIGEVDNEITFPKSQFKRVFAKRKNKLEKVDDNFYPSFSVTEICFSDELTASENLSEISKIIDGQDLFNEKKYDYILQNHNKIIYVSSRAKVFEKFAFEYKEIIKEIIKTNNAQ